MDASDTITCTQPEYKTKRNETNKQTYPITHPPTQPPIHPPTQPVTHTFTYPPIQPTKQTNEKQSKYDLGISLNSSLHPDYICGVANCTSCLKFLTLCFAHHGGIYFQTMS